MSTKTSEAIALFDMDGTLCDFDSEMRWQLNELRAPGDDSELDKPEYEEVPHMKARRRLIKNRPGFWRNLQPLEQGMTLYRMARKLEFKTHILTKGPRHSPNAFTEKVEWCKVNVPDALITISEDKGLVYGKFLVDDWPDYITRWLEWRPRGFIFMPDQPWNKHVSHPQVMRVTDNYDEVFDKMHAIRNSIGDV